MRLLAVLALAAVALAASAQPLQRWGGGPAPSLRLPDAQGVIHRLEDYRGRTVLVNFWATWCGPCREEMPSMERLRRDLQGEPFAILAVNVGEGQRAVRTFAQKMSLGFPLLLDRDTGTTRAWGARVLPASFVIDPRGEIRYFHYGALDWGRADVRSAIEALTR